MQYNQALQQRNNLLKTMNRSSSFSSELLEPWDYRLSMHADVINRERAAFIEAFSPVFLEVYQKISGGKEEVRIALDAEFASVPLSEKLAHCRERDRVLERTTIGPHKDDLNFELNGLSLKKFASQGQQKSFLIALKLAQYLILKKNTQLVPILLLDDLYDKVDETRVMNLLQWLIDHHSGQVFITDTHVDRIPALLQRLNAGYNAFIISQNSYSTTEVAHEF
jgi:DNA replication and repair protein RecF